MIHQFASKNASIHEAVMNANVKQGLDSWKMEGAVRLDTVCSIIKMARFCTNKSQNWQKNIGKNLQCKVVF